MGNALIVKEKVMLKIKLVILMVCLASQISFGAILYGAKDQKLYSIDTSDWSVETIREYSFAGSITAGLACDPDGYMYTTNNFLYGVREGNRLQCIDPIENKVSEIFLQRGYNGRNITSGLAYNNDDGYLYGATKDHLYRIDSHSQLTTTTWSYTIIPFTDGYSPIYGGLAYNNDDGYLYGAGDDNLYRIDITNNSISKVLANSGYAINGGLTYSNGDACFYGANGTTLYRIDPIDWSVSIALENGPYISGGLASVHEAVPEPATMLLFIFGGIILRKKRL
jgi:hypothetical protein